MTKRILVIGKSGQLGKSIAKVSSSFSDLEVVFVDRSDFDLNSVANVREFFRKQKHFHVIINAAAYTNVEAAELNFEMAAAVNHLAVSELANIAKEQNALFIFVSTDYVFDGQKTIPYLEEDSLGPLNKYGLSKMRGEEAILASGCSGVIVRSSWLYSEFGNNFVKTMLSIGRDLDRVNVVCDQVGSPTYALDLAKILLQLSLLDMHDGVEIFHYANEGVCSWFDFAQAIFEMSNMQTEVNPIAAKDYSTQVSRPRNSALNTSKIQRQLGIDIPHWRDSLQHCLHELKKC